MLGLGKESDLNFRARAFRESIIEKVLGQTHKMDARSAATFLDKVLDRNESVSYPDIRGPV
jgi:hypothetical protein